jgi:hypothetical protein
MAGVRSRVLPAVAAAALLAACARPPAAAVGEVRISQAQLGRDVRLFRFLSELSGATCGQPVEDESPEAACARFTLQNLIQEEVAKAYAERHGITVPSSRVEETLERLEASLGPEGLEPRLAAAGIDRQDLRDLARRLLLFDAVRRAVVREVVTDEELRRDYEDQQVRFTTLHAAHILVATRKEAEQIRARITPANFARMARHFSTDRASARNGGDLGEVPANQFDPDFVAAALALQPGEISQPVRTSFGWHIIRLVSSHVRPFEEVREQLLGERADVAFSDWVRQQLARTTVSLNPRYGVFDVETGVVLPIRSTSTASPAAGAP